MSNSNDLYWDIENLYTEGIGPKRIAEMLSCDIQIVYEVLEDMGVTERQRKPKRGKIATKMRDNMGYNS